MSSQIMAPESHIYQDGPSRYFKSIFTSKRVFFYIDLYFPISYTDRLTDQANKS